MINLEFTMGLQRTTKVYRSDYFKFYMLIPRSVVNVILNHKAWAGKKGEYVKLDTKGGNLTSKGEDNIMPIRYWNHFINDRKGFLSEGDLYSATPHTIEVTWRKSNRKLTVECWVLKRHKNAVNWEPPRTPPKTMPV